MGDWMYHLKILYSEVRKGLPNISFETSCVLFLFTNDFLYSGYLKIVLPPFEIRKIYVVLYCSDNQQVP